MGAIFALIPLKDWVYCGILVAVLAGGAWFIHHERVIGEQKIEAQDTAIAVAAQRHNSDVEAIAAATQTSIGETYAKTVAVPVVSPITARLCHNAAGSGAVSKAASGSAGANGPTVLGGTNPGDLEAGPDIAGPLLTVGRDDDAKIIALQAEVSELRAEMQK
jgi:hypothetical protein